MQTRYMTQRTAYVLLLVIGCNVFDYTNRLLVRLAIDGWYASAARFFVPLLVVYLVSMWLNKSATVKTTYKG